MRKHNYASLIAPILILVVVLGIVAGYAFIRVKGNVQMIDTTYHYNRAIISLPDGKTVSGQVQSWKDYENCDQIQVKIDGKTYYTHSANVILIAD